MPEITCSANAARAFDFFLSKGLRDYQSAGIVGNLQHESGLNPSLAVLDINGKMSRGIAMWQPLRWNNLLTFAAGRDPWALDTQLDFIWAELPSNGLDQLLASPALEDAVVVFQDRFERPRRDLAHTDNRIALAKSMLYTCPAIRPPAPEPVAKKLRATAVVGAALGLVTLTAYGLYRAFRAEPALEPPRPPRPLPPLRPQPPFRYRTRPFPEAP